MTAPGAPAKKSKGVWIGLILILLSIVIGIAGVVVGVSSIAGQANKFTTLQSPGTSTVNLSAGDYGLYVSSNSFASVRNVTITGPSGQSIPTRVDATSSSYSSGSKNLSGLGSFTAPESGTYTFEVADTVSSSASFEVGPTIGALIGTGLAFIFGGIGLSSILFIIGIIVLIVGLVRRGRAKRASIPPYQGGMPPGGGYVPPGGPTYQQPPMPGGYQPPAAPGAYPQQPQAPGGYPQQPQAPGGYPQQQPPAPGGYQQPGPSA